MIMPFIRLVTIYIIVIVAVIAVFKRDQIMELAGWSFDTPPAAQAEPEKPAQTAAVEPATPAPVVTPATAPAPVPQPAPEPAQEPPAAPAETQTVAEPEIEQPTVTPAPVAASKPAPQQTDSDLQTRLTEARRAYWAGDLAKAEALYVALAQDAPTNPDVNGELGNILYAQRRYAEAADAYLATGKLLVGHANPAQILSIIGVLQSIAPQKAQTLRALASN